MPNRARPLYRCVFAAGVILSLAPSLSFADDAPPAGGRPAQTTPSVAPAGTSLATVVPSAEQDGKKKADEQGYASKADLARVEKALEEVKAGPNGGAAAAAITSFFQGLNVSGFLESQYIYNFNDPETNTNGFRVFDNRANTFRFHNAEVDISKATKSVGDTGFRLVTNMGQDANIIASTGTGNTDEFDVQQAYGEWIAPVGDGLNLKFGKFATLLGAEVIEGAAIDQVSRSFLFGFAIPFTHTGLRATYTKDMLTFCGGINNGWDIVNDNNRRPTFEAQVSAAPNEIFSCALGGITGPEQASVTGHPRQIVDAVVTVKPCKCLTLKANYDYATEQTTIRNQWNGFAGYARWQINDRWAVSGRAEYFTDDDGFRTGLTQDLTEWTFTGEYKFASGPMVRLESRWDRSNNNSAFPDSITGATRANQETVALQVIVPF